MEARLLLDSDDANGDYGHGSYEGWEGQGTTAEAGGGNRTGNSGDGVSESLHW